MCVALGGSFKSQGRFALLSFPSASATSLCPGIRKAHRRAAEDPPLICNISNKQTFVVVYNWGKKPNFV